MNFLVQVFHSQSNTEDRNTIRYDRTTPHSRVVKYRLLKTTFRLLLKLRRDEEEIHWATEWITNRNEATTDAKPDVKPNCSVIAAKRLDFYDHQHVFAEIFCTFRRSSCRSPDR